MKKLILALTSICLVSCMAVAKENSVKEISSKKTLVVYYSATGTTERVAKIIAELTNAHLLELEPVEPYTDEDLNYSDSNSRVMKEHNSENPHTPLKNAVVKDLDKYENIYIGAPHWWRKAAWVIDDFLKLNEFKNIKMIPFCTSISTPYANTGREMQKIANGGNWVEGERFGTRASRAEIENFVKRVQ